MTTDDPTDGFTGTINFNQVPWFPCTITLADASCTITLYADGKWEGSIEGLRSALANGKSFAGDATSRMLLWLILRQMENDAEVLVMRDLHELDKFRVTDPDALKHTGGWSGDDTHGAFVILSAIDKARMVVIAAADQGWDHISISRKNRVPNWAEMTQVYQMFFLPDEVAMQLHMPREQHINVHPFVLHLWRPHQGAIPLPPRLLV